LGDDGGSFDAVHHGLPTFGDAGGWPADPLMHGDGA
jgi:hypothetical protein